VHLRGWATIALGVVAGLVVFGCSAGLSSRVSLATDSPASGVMTWLNALPGEQNRSAPVSERQSLVATAENRGQVLFGRYCDSCHYGGNENIGASLRSSQFKRTYTAKEKIADFVRKGGFDMPAFSRAFLSDADLDAISEYVRTLPETR
jgi:mono/diheme cytochrome c family protein